MAHGLLPRSCDRESITANALSICPPLRRSSEISPLTQRPPGQSFGRIDIMVNNAGIETRTSVLDTTEAQYDKVLEINLKGAFFGTQLAARQMVQQGGGGRT